MTPPSQAPTPARSFVVAAAASWRPLLLLHAAALALCAIGLPRLGLDNSPQAFFVDDAVALEHYREFQLLFGRDHLLRVVLEGPGLWTDPGVAWLGDLEHRLAGLRGVLGAAGPGTHHRLAPSAREPDPERSADLVPPPIRVAEPAAELRRLATQDPLDRAAGWVSADGETVTVLVVLYDLPAADRRRTIAAVKEAAGSPPPGIENRVVGLPVLAETLDREVLDVAWRTFPLLLVFSVGLLFAVFRSASTLAAPLLFVGFVQTVVLGSMGFAGVRINVVHTVLMPLLFVLSLATALYLSIEYRDRRAAGADPRDRDGTALLACYRERGWPVLWAGLTTAAGFGSLALAELPPVRSLGLWAGLGIVLATAEAFLLYPALLAALATRARPSAGPAFETASGPLGHPLGRRVGRRLGRMALEHRQAVLLAFSTVAALSLLALPRLEIAPGPLDLFAPSQPVRADIESLEARGIAVVAGELVLRAPQDADAPFATPEALRALDEVAEELRSTPGVTSVLTPYDLLAAAVRVDREASQGAREAASSTVPSPPPTDAELERALRAFRARSDDLEPLLAATLTRDDRAARISVMVPMAAPSLLDAIFDRAEASARSRFPGLRVWLTGVYPLVLEGRSAILETMGASLLLTLAVVAALFAWVTRSVSGLLACLLPNLLAVLLVLGLMAVSGVPLDSTTLMIAAVVLGLAVDDTFHLLGAFRRRAGRLDAESATLAALEHAAPGILVTSATLVGGFLLCGLSPFVPVARFGLLTAAAMLLALIGDLLLTPVLLASLGPRQVRALRPAELPDGTRPLSP